jgi:translocator protein
MAIVAAWTGLGVATAVGGWRVWCRAGAGPEMALWGWQVLAAALWTAAFFGLRSPLAGLVAMLPLLGLTAATVRAFLRIERVAAALVVPALLGSLYAAYLDLGFWWLNRG